MKNVEIYQTDQRFRWSHKSEVIGIMITYYE